MIYHSALALQSYFSFLNVVHYVSFRTIAALLTTLITCITLGSVFIALSQKFFTAKARAFTPENHTIKDGMPTMGGIFILVSVIINVFLWCNLFDRYVWIFCACIIGFAGIGFLDDWGKIKNNKGLSSSFKFFLQVAVAAGIVVWWVSGADVSFSLSLPFFKMYQPYLGSFFIVWAIFILVGVSNAVNLTDGLDGLAVGSLIPNFVVFSFLCYLASNSALAHYLHIPYMPCGEIAVLGGILVGASLGFLWYNAYPAQIFMGDVGSLSLGAGLALMALMSKQELLLPLAGFLFVVEVLSVIMQVYVFRSRGTRLFKMAPIHHHFELLGWPESKITVRFGIISFVFCLLALITLKLR